MEFTPTSDYDGRFASLDFEEGAQVFAETLPTADYGRFDVCVIGAGAAGIAMAVEFARTELQVVVLEGGGLGPGDHDLPLHEPVAGAEITLRHSQTMTSYLGGNTNHWYGNCRPLESADFAKRPWIAHSGWPIDRDELDPYYAQAQEIAGLGSFSLYDPAVCLPALGLGSEASRQHGPLVTRIEQATLTPDLAELHRETLAAAPNVYVVLRHRVVRLHASTKDTIESVIVVAPDGTEHQVMADRFVLAAGGIENARFLLNAANDGAVTRNDLVGRYFMDHPFFAFDADYKLLRNKLGSKALGLYTVGSGRTASLKSHGIVQGSRIWGQLVIAPEVARAQGTPGMMFYFLAWSGLPPVLDALRVLRRGAEGSWFRRMLRGFGALIRHPTLAIQYVVHRVTGRPPAWTTIKLVAQPEQKPDPENRVALVDEVDQFGVRDVALRSRMDDEQLQQHSRSLSAAANELGLAGDDMARQFASKYSEGDFGFFWHHIGTTRMGETRELGVVDQNGRVHDTTNLYVTGSSVFPTAGTAAPTLTILALASRLASHLKSDVGHHKPSQDE
jgi:choline dehydrogenase-like flavoprotein